MAAVDAATDAASTEAAAATKAAGTTTGAAGATEGGGATEGAAATVATAVGHGNNRCIVVYVSTIPTHVFFLTYSFPT